MKTAITTSSLVLGLAVCAQANQYTFLVPSDGGKAATTLGSDKDQPNDLGDLDHGKFYLWGLRWALPVGETIKSAYLSFDAIYNWQREDNVLHIDLLNDPTGAAIKAKFGTTSYTSYKSAFDLTGNAVVSKSDSYMTDAFGSFLTSSPALGVKLTDWSDTKFSSPGTPLSVPVQSKDFSWLADGAFAFGIDPDCHFYNKEIKFTIETEKVSTPDAGSTAALMIPALGALAYFRRRS